MSEINKIEEWLDNTTRLPGILKFAQEFIPDFTKSRMPSFHIDLVKEILFNYANHHQSKMDRRTGIVAFRGSAKTTIDTVLLPIYNLCFKGFTSALEYKGGKYALTLGEDIIIMACKNHTLAEQRVVNVRNMLVGENKLTQFFGQFKPQQVRDGKNNEWRQSLFFAKQPDIYPDYAGGTYIAGVGTGEMIRGLNIGGYRPSLIVFDDIYSQENTVTPERRQKIDSWFHTEALGSLDDVAGKAIFIGTIVHEDTVPVKIKENSKSKTPLWRYMEIPAISPEEFNNILDKVNYDRNLGKFEFPDDLRIKEWQDECKSIAWPERLGLRALFGIFYDNLLGKTLDYMYQEYLNIVQAPENKRFDQGMFVKAQLHYKYQDGYNWVGIQEDIDDDNSDIKWYNANIYFGVDLASSERLTADETVIAVIATLNDGRIAILQIKHGRMGQRDELHEPDSNDTYRRQMHEIKKVGVVDEVLRLAEVYNPNMIGIEIISEQLKTYQEVARLMRICGVHYRLFKFKPTSNKIERITDTLIGHYQVGGVIHNKGLTELEYQLEKLGKAKHDDMADAVHIAFHIGARRKPEKIEYDDKGKIKKKVLNLIRDWRLI